MALNKQRILSELGSVMNQLQSADCGCMGKLFSDPGQGGMGHPLPTCGGCRRGSCRGHGAPCGDPAGGMCGMGMGGGMPGMGGGMGGGMRGGMGCGMAGGMGSGMGGGMAGMRGGMTGMGGGMTGMGGNMGGGMPGMGGAHNGLESGMGGGGMGGRGMGMPCMGSCNPKKVYAETYNYLNQNLMQPVVQDVYQELSSINQSNTVGNNPLANTMGLTPGNSQMQGNAQTQGNAAMQGNPMMQGNATGDPNVMHNMSGMPAGNTMGHNPNQQMGGAMGGMGAQIMNMMGGMMGGGGKPKGVSNDGQMVIDAPQSPHAQVGVAPMNQMGQSSGQANASMGQGFMNPQTQYVTQDNMYGSSPTGQNNPMASQPGNAKAMTGGMTQAQPMAGGNMGQQQMMGNMAQGNAVQNVSAPTQGGAGFTNQPPNMGMANDARYGKHLQGMKKFNEMFPGLMNGDLGFDPMAIAIQMNPANQKRSAIDTMNKMLNGNFTRMEPAVAGANAAAYQLNQAPQQPQQNQVPANQMPSQQMMNQQNLAPSGHVSEQPGANSGGFVPQQNQQQVYQAVTGNQQYQQGQQQQMIDPNTGAIVNVPEAEYQGNEGDSNAQQQSDLSNQTAEPAQQQKQQQLMYKEPIFPAFTRNQVLGIAPPQSQKQYVYNTLGQPVQLLPGNAYHTPEPSLPQTLAGKGQTKFKSPGGKLGVKSTVSKTSLMGIKPTARVPSKSQLQQIYQQYKGSQSGTNQNVARMPGQAGSLSAGKLNEANNNVNQPPQIPIEKVGGDTAANNNQVINKVEHVMGQIGDVPAAQKGAVDKAPPMGNARLRNGLQDIVYTSAPSNVSWSFHGEYNPNTAYRSIYR